MGCVLDDGEGLTMWCVFDDREVEWGRIRGTGEIEDQSLVFCIIGFYVLSRFRKKKKTRFKIIIIIIMLTWKIVERSEASVLYIY